MMIVPGLLSESSLNLTELYKSPTQFLDHYVVKTSPSVGEVFQIENPAEAKALGEDAAWRTQETGL